MPTDRGYLERFLQSHTTDKVVFEACAPSGWLNDLCQQLKLPTLVSSTNDEAWQWKKTKRKTDKDDALKLARLAMLQQLQPVHFPLPHVREMRMLIKYRKTVDARINRIKNAIRSLFANHGINIDSGKRAWCSGRKHIDSFRKPFTKCKVHELWRGELDLELTQLDALAKQLKEIESQLVHYARTSAGYRRKP